MRSSHHMTADTVLPKLLGPKIAKAPQILFLDSLLASVLQQESYLQSMFIHMKLSEQSEQSICWSVYKASMVACSQHDNTNSTILHSRRLQAHPGMCLAILWPRPSLAPSCSLVPGSTSFTFSVMDCSLWRWRSVPGTLSCGGTHVISVLQAKQHAPSSSAPLSLAVHGNLPKYFCRCCLSTTHGG